MSLPRYGLDTCRHCGQPIRWTRTTAGRRQPVNPEPDPAGNVAAYLDGISVWRSRVPTAELPITMYERLFMPHAATCLYSPGGVTEARLPPGVSSLAARRRRQQRRGPRG